MKIVFTQSFKRKLNKVRRGLVVLLNMIKTLMVMSGSVLLLLASAGVDGPEGNISFKFAWFSLGIIFSGIALEIFTVKFLVKDNEYMPTIFDFDFYGLKSKYNYMAYHKFLNKRKEKIEKVEDKNSSNVITVNFTKGA